MIFVAIGFICFGLVEAHNRTDCGRSIKVPFINSQIIGGSDASPDAWPWMASVQTRDTSGNFVHHCGGTLVKVNWVVTAAHCVIGRQPGDLRVVLGAININNLDGKEQTVMVSQLTTHQQFDNADESRRNDIAVLQLATNADVSKANIGYSCIPYAEYPYQDSPACFISGWGRKSESNTSLSDVLQEAHVDIIQNEECADDLPIFGADLYDTQICTYDEINDSKSACRGDEGGPLVCRVDNQWDLVGVASWHGSSDCAVDTPTVFTRVQSFRDWILERIGQPTL